MQKNWTQLLLSAALMAAAMAAAAWFTEGFLRIVLLTVLYFALSEILTSMARLALGEPEPVKGTKEEMLRAENQWYTERQDPAVIARMRPVGYVLWGVSFLLIFTGFIPVGPYELHSIACIVCFLACVILCAVYPAYFSIAYMEGEKNRNENFPIVGLMIPVFLSLGAGAIRAVLEFPFVSWLAVLEGMLVTAAVCGMVLRVAVPEFRRHTSNWVCAVILVLMFSLGLAAQVNHFLAPPPQIVTVMVMEYHPGANRNPANYTMRLENGEEITMPAHHTFLIGQKILLEYHEGALGIDYYTYHD